MQLLGCEVLDGYFRPKENWISSLECLDWVVVLTGLILCKS